RGAPLGSLTSGMARRASEKTRKTRRTMRIWTATMMTTPRSQSRRRTRKPRATISTCHRTMSGVRASSRRVFVRS
ncbi:hypothetical protein PHISCL_11193, partial [Aspergillus sclerotialis]